MNPKDVNPTKATREPVSGGRWLQRSVYQLSRAAVTTLTAFSVRFEFHGAAHLPASGAFVLAANHISHFDPLLIALGVRRTVVWMATREFFRGVLAAYLHAVGAFPVDRSGRDPAAVREAVRHLRKGARLGIFPEGGIRAGANSVLEGAPLRAGVERLAAMARVPVVPCVILGSDRLYNPRQWQPWRRTGVWVGFGAPILPHEWKTSDGLLGQRMRALCAEMQGVFALQPDDLPATPAHRKGRE